MKEAFVISVLVAIFGIAVYLLRKQSKKFRQEEFDRLDEEMD